MSAPLLEASGLVVERGGRPVLHGVDLTLGHGEGIALVGPNAAGKSTLVRTLAGLLRPRRGTVRLKGRLLSDWPREALARTVALVTPEDEAPPMLTVADRVMLGRYPHRGRETQLRPFGERNVRAEGKLLQCDPAETLPLAQRYFLF